MAWNETTLVSHEMIEYGTRGSRARIEPTNEPTNQPTRERERERERSKEREREGARYDGCSTEVASTYVSVSGFFSSEKNDRIRSLNEGLLECDE